MRLTQRVGLAGAHRLTASDAVHLASAATVPGEGSVSGVFPSWVRRLEQAARRQGLALRPSP